MARDDRRQAMGRPPNQLGRRIGAWVVVDVERRPGERLRYHVACSRCGRRIATAARAMAGLGACGCDPERRGDVAPPLAATAWRPGGGDWVVIASEGRRYRAECRRCHRQTTVLRADVARMQPCGCGERPPRPEWPLIDHWTPFEQDALCRAVVARNPRGLNLSTIGRLMGIGYEGARLIEQAAIRKLREENPEALRGLLGGESEDVA
jgi:hypothetical protein